jgi:hypothetical protein
MSKMYLDYDPFSGIAHWVSTDETTGITTYGVDQEVDTIIEANKIAYNEDHGRYADLEPVARIPLTLLAEWIREGKDKDQVFLKRFFNDPENQAFRLRPGVI